MELMASYTGIPVLNKVFYIGDMVDVRYANMSGTWMAIGCLDRDDNDDYIVVSPTPDCPIYIWRGDIISIWRV